MFAEGTTFFISPDPHLWVIISDPVQNEDEIVHVNFTSINGTWGSSNDPQNDRSCVIQPGEHEFVTHPTFVYYYGVQIVSLSFLQCRYESGRLRFHKPVTRTLLNRIRQGAAVSDHFLPRAYDILQDQRLV
jgi:hypothetical protein